MRNNQDANEKFEKSSCCRVLLIECILVSQCLLCLDNFTSIRRMKRSPASTEIKMQTFEKGKIGTMIPSKKQKGEKHIVTCLGRTFSLLVEGKNILILPGKNGLANEIAHSRRSAIGISENRRTLKMVAQAQIMIVFFDNCLIRLCGATSKNHLAPPS